MASDPRAWPFQSEGSGLSPSTVVGSEDAVRSGPKTEWTEEEFAKARPLPLPQPSLPRARPVEDGWPVTFIPSRVDIVPYSSICKIFFRRNNQPYVASGWVVHGNTGVKGIITSGHVVYDGGMWSQDYVVLRSYTNGHYAERLNGNYARTLHGWMHGAMPREFWDVGAIIPDALIPAQTPSLPVVANYDPIAPAFRFFADPGYPAKPANHFPFDGNLMWESNGPLINVHVQGQQAVLQAYNAMEQGSSGSPWLVWDQNSGTYWAAGQQTSGWDGTPSSYSPYFEQRNILTLLRDIGVIR